MLSQRRIKSRKGGASSEEKYENLFSIVKFITFSGICLMMDEINMGSALVLSFSTFIP